MTSVEPRIARSSATCSASSTLASLSLAAVMLLLAACGGSDGSGAAPEVGTPAPPSPPASAASSALLASVDYAAAAKPVDVTPALDADQTVTADVDLTGGTLTVTGANGTRYTLVIPDRALASATRITMQAVTALGGQPAGMEIVHGVQLEPSGLTFLNEALLTIEPVAAIPVERQAFFGYGSAGSDFHLVPPARTASLQIRVFHFSGYGVAQLGRERSVTTTFNEVVPRDAGARLRQAIAKVLSDERSKQLLGSGSADVDPGDGQNLIKGYLLQYQREVLNTLVNAAGSSCANGIKATQEVLSFERLVALLGLAEDIPSIALPDNFRKIVRNKCFDEAEQRCRVSGDYLSLIATSFELERQEQLSGDTTDDPTTETRERAAVERCARYELEFDNTQAVDFMSPLGAQRLAVATVVRLKLPEGWVDGTEGLEGEAPLTYTETSSRPNCFIDGCSYYEVVSTNPATAKVRRGKLSFTPYISTAVWSLGTPVERTGSFDVEFNDGQPTEVIDTIVRINGGFQKLPGTPSLTLPYWSNFYHLLHQDEAGSEPDWNRWNRDWTSESISYPVLFERKLDRTSDTLQGAVDLSDLTVVRLVHKPAP